MQVFDQVLPSPTQSLNRDCACVPIKEQQKREKLQNETSESERVKNIYSTGVRREQKKYSTIRRLRLFSQVRFWGRCRERERASEELRRWRIITKGSSQRRLVALSHLNLKALRIFTQPAIVSTCDCLEKFAVQVVSWLFFLVDFFILQLVFSFIATTIFSLEKIRYT